MAKPKNTSARLKALQKLLKDGRPRSALELAAIRRQQLDLDEGHKRGLVWDEDAAVRAIQFFSLLKHWKDPWAGKPFVLEPWQEQGIIAPLFGWMRADDGSRRFRTGYIEVPRKNGKTTLCAGIALQGLLADGEHGAEVYAAATMRDQAKIVFNDSRRCLGPALRKLVTEFNQGITFERLAGTFRPLSAEYGTLDGLNPSRVIVDEFHAHPSRGLWDVLLGGQGARRQPLIVAITTAGVDRTSICYEVREKLARAVLEGAPGHNDSVFAFIACADDADDWQSPETWRKANPNYGITVKPESLAELAKQSAVSGSAESNFRRKHLNQWVGAESTWIEPATWDKGKLALSPNNYHLQLAGKPAFGGLDLGWRDDFAALGMVVPDRVRIGDDLPVAEEAPTSAANRFCRDPSAITAKWKIRRCWLELHLWVPENGKRDIHEAPLADWIAAGLVNVTEGNTTDFDAIMLEIEEASRYFRLLEVALDPNNARQPGQEITASGLTVVHEFRQNKLNYNEPCREFERLAGAGLCHHDGNPVLRWMMGNVVMEADARGYVMPAKQKSADKIDGPVALLMGFARAMFSDSEQQSIYATAGEMRW